MPNVLLQVLFPEPNDVIETFAPVRADQTLNIRSFQRRSGSGENFGDLQVRELRDIVRKFGGKLALNCYLIRGGTVRVEKQRSGPPAS